MQDLQHGSGVLDSACRHWNRKWKMSPSKTTNPEHEETVLPQRIRRILTIREAMGPFFSWLVGGWNRPLEASGNYVQQEYLCGDTRKNCTAS